MKSLVFGQQTFGPFSQISKESDHYNCDGTIYPFSVVGDDGIEQKWVPPPPPPPPAPKVVTMRQARLALLQAGKLADVDAAILALPSPDKETAQISWEYATEVRRDSALMQQLATAIGLTEADLDSLFTQAVTL
jgi:hypothetical protein